MLDTIRNISSSALSFALRLAGLLLLLATVYTVYRFANSLPEGNVAQGKVKFKLVDYERDTAPSIIVIDKTPTPVANASCGTPCGRCNTGCDNTVAPQQPSMVQTISINTAAVPSVTAPAPRPVAPPPAPKPVETATCGN